jgi:hypothetical protein
MRSRKSAAGTAREKAAAVVDGARDDDKAAAAPDTSTAPPRRARQRAAAEAEAPALPGMGEVADQVEADDEHKAQAEAARRATATTDPAELALGSGYDRIVDTLFDLPDPYDTYQLVKRSLQLGTRASRADYGTLVDALDAAQDMADKAYDLYVNAKTAADSYEIDAKAIESGMRDQAMAALMEEYKAKQRPSPKNDDVDAYMAAKFPDEWRDIQQRRGRARRMVRKLENLATRASERAKDLRQMVARARDA